MSEFPEKESPEEKEKRKAAFQAGVKARRAGQAHTTNPFSGMLGGHWWNGWQSGATSK